MVFFNILSLIGVSFSENSGGETKHNIRYAEYSCFLTLAKKKPDNLRNIALFSDFRRNFCRYSRRNLDLPRKW